MLLGGLLLSNLFALSLLYYGYFGSVLNYMSLFTVYFPLSLVAIQIGITFCSIVLQFIFVLFTLKYYRSASNLSYTLSLAA